MRIDRFRRGGWLSALAVLACAAGSGAAFAAGDVIFMAAMDVIPIPLNDTGIVWSGDAESGNAAICDPAHPAGQDCHHGRDAAAAAGTLSKLGASTPNAGIENGFDYTKISNSGNPLPASAALGSGPNDWACTRDNVTGLVWEVKTADGGLRDQGHTYTWYDSASPDGNPGTADGGSCFQAGRCDTEKYAADVNAQSLCGHADWRMPSRRELLSLVDSGRRYPAIDPVFFPDIASSIFWSASPYASYSQYAWCVFFGDGISNYGNRSNVFSVRLVRGGQ